MHSPWCGQLARSISAESCQHVSRHCSEYLKPKRYGRFLYSTRVLGKPPKTASKKWARPGTRLAIMLCAFDGTLLWPSLAATNSETSTLLRCYTANLEASRKTLSRFPCLVNRRPDSQGSATSTDSQANNHKSTYTSQQNRKGYHQKSSSKDVPQSSTVDNTSWKSETKS